MAAEGWRSADPRGDPPPPASVSAVVQRVHLGVEAARWAQSAFFCAAAALLALAAGALSGPSYGGRGSLAVAAAAGLAAALAWRLKHRASTRDVARRLDGRLRHQGALVTAYELERSGASGALAALCRARVLQRLRTGEALRALLPPLFLPLLAPFLSALALALALEHRAREPRAPRADLVRLGAGIEAGVASLAADALADHQAGLLDEAGARAAPALAARLQGVARVASEARETGGSPLATGEPLHGAHGAHGALAELDALERELADLGARAVRPARVAADLERLRPWLDALRTELEARAGVGDPARAAPGADQALAERSDGGEPGDAPGDPSSGVAGAGAGLGAGDAAGDATRAPNRLAPAGAVGTMSPRADPSSDPIPSPGLPGGPEAGLAGAWWPPEHDEVVRRWVEARRAALDPDAAQR